MILIFPSPEIRSGTLRSGSFSLRCTLSTRIRAVQNSMSCFRHFHELRIACYSLHFVFIWFAHVLAFNHVCAITEYTPGRRLPTGSALESPVVNFSQHKKISVHFMETRSPGDPRATPEVILIFRPISLAIENARRVFPRPCFPVNST